MLTVIACFQAYVFGANRIGFATGPLQATVKGDPTILFLVAIAGLILSQYPMLTCFRPISITW